MFISAVKAGNFTISMQVLRSKERFRYVGKKRPKGELEMGETQGVRPEASIRPSTSDAATVAAKNLAGRSVTSFKIVKDREGNVTRQAIVDGSVIVNETMEAHRPYIQSVPESEQAASEDVLAAPQPQANTKPDQAPEPLAQKEETGFFERTYKAAKDSLSSLMSDITGWAGNSTVANDVKGRRNDVELQ